ncbi:MAG: hypothetical protein JWQ27_3272 [Ferruginibacter sp.]|nr:hypothetical protein [Ferruginibacter sp.]
MKYFFPLICAALFVSCSSAKQATVAQTVEAARYDAKLPDSLVKKLNTGVDYFASGNNPVSWKLEMDFDKRFLFSSNDGSFQTTAPVKAMPLADGSGSSYRTENGVDKLIVTVLNTGCAGGTDNKSGNNITVSYNDKVYSGCGKFLYDNRLSDIWVMERAGEMLLRAGDFSKGLPEITLNLLTNTMTGSDGCNNISSPINVEGSRIRFGNVVSTKMACKNSRVQNIIAAQISNSLVDYYFRDGKLYFYLLDDSVLVFQKKSN